ncbi:MAG TPA: DUF1800 domain-containing protein [Tepidisphaeraceae bacterium]
MIQLHPQLQPFVPGESDSFDSVKAAHLLNRAGFGGKPAEVAAIAAMGPKHAVDAIMDFPDAEAAEESRTDQPDFSAIEDYPKSFEERRQLLLGKTDEERKALIQQFMAKNREAMAEVLNWWLKRMTAGQYPLHEKLTFFWHGHFTTSARDERAAWLMWTQNETLRRNAAGNFRTFVKEISRDPAMLDYLNNQENRKAHPNENYARELMELFTLGIGNYTEQDVKEGARAFTGWGHDGEEFIYRKFDHDNGVKTFFGRSGNFDGDDVIELILQNPACAPYIAKCLLTFFVQDEPDPAICKSLGAVLRENNYDLRPALRTMFASKLFYSSDVIGGQIKSPVQLAVGTMRLLEVDPPVSQQLFAALDQMGQVPFGPPNVKGWPGGRSWINTSTLFVRYNTAVWLAGGGPAIAGGGNVARFVQMPQSGGFFGARPQFNPSASGSANEVADLWIARLIQRPIAEDRRQILVDALGSKPDEQSSVKKMIQLIVSMPEYQLC